MAHKYSNCDHTLAVLHSDHTVFIHMSDIGDVLAGYAEEINAHRANTSWLYRKEPTFVEPADLLDGRYGHSTQFKYCPYCSKWLDWKQIRRTIREATKEQENIVE